MVYWRSCAEVQRLGVVVVVAGVEESWRLRWVLSVGHAQTRDLMAVFLERWPAPLTWERLVLHRQLRLALLVRVRLEPALRHSLGQDLDHAGVAASAEAVLSEACFEVGRFRQGLEPKVRLADLIAFRAT